jgi:hypothetical protein
MNPEVLLAAGYASALVFSAFVLEFLSAHTHQRSMRYRTAGFRYDPDRDLWVCPEEESLWPVEFDRERRLVRYRGKSQVCNACPKKGDCTDSDSGREVVRPLDPWPHSEAGRFHRALALLMVALAAMLLVVEAARHHEAPELALLGCLLLVSLLSARWLVRDLRHHPANFPTPTSSRGLDFAVTDADGTPALTNRRLQGGRDGG